MAVSLYEKFDAKEVNKELVSGPATVISVVPVMLKQLLVDLGARKYNSSFKVVLLGGGPIDVETLKVTQQKNINVVQSYGMTETASQIVALDSQTAPYHIGSSGKPLNTVQLKIKKIKENDKFGNILIKSPTLTPGYLNLPGKLEKDIDSEGWFDTGDLGYLDEEGFLYVKGRLGDMINSGGENIFPVEIEDVLRKYNGVIDIVVVGIPDEKWGQIPIAFVIGDVDFEQLREFGRKHLAHYKVPNKYIKVKDFPRTASGKIQRNKLIENY
jgi:O-succinylbenzoic acid--CoA ligase